MQVFVSILILYYMDKPFWEHKMLADMSVAEWESLCDGCALCCMHKLEDEDSGEILFTDVACKLLDIESCRCTNYGARSRLVKACLILAPDKPAVFSWLPGTCAYRRLAEGDDLPPWHPLITGDFDSVHEAGVSVQGKATSERENSEPTVFRNLST